MPRKDHALSWNLRIKNLPAQVGVDTIVEPRINNLAKLLTRFPPSSVHLMVHVERRSSPLPFSAALTLRLPTELLQADREGQSVEHAVKNAFEAIEESVKAHEPGWREGSLWRQPAAPGPNPEALPPIEPETRVDMLIDHFRGLYPQLRTSLTRRIRILEDAGDIPSGSLDPCGILNEIARRILEGHAARPSGRSHGVWYYDLALRELKRRTKAISEEVRLRIPKPSDPRVARMIPGDEAEGYDVENPLDVILSGLREEELPEDAIPDPEAELPYSHLDRDEALQAVLDTVRELPLREREIHHLYFEEGLRPNEIATLLRMKTVAVQEKIDRLRALLRKRLDEILGS